MPAGQRPLVRRRLRLELREERERAGKSQNEVAREMDWSISKIIRLEAGQVGISTNDLKALLDLYGVDNSQRRTFLLDLARSARQQSSWWSAYRDIVPDGDYADFLGFETDSAVIWCYSPLIVPALLQTEEYARELFVNNRAGTPPEERVERQVELRMARKRHTLDRDKPLELGIVIDEAVIHRTVGGAEVMNDQLTSIADVSTLDNITVQVIPFTAGAHPGLLAAFEILEFPDPADTPVLQFDARPQSVVLRDDIRSVERYRETFKSLKDLALSEEESRDLINQVAEAMLVS